MAVLEGERLIEDRWIAVADGEPVPVDQPAIVTSARLLAESRSLAPGRRR